MACVHAFSLKAPAASGILHWGATSCFVTDGAELIMMRDGLDILLPKLARTIHQLKQFAIEYKDLPCLAYTHGQPAQPTTVFTLLSKLQKDNRMLTGYIGWETFLSLDPGETIAVCSLHFHFD